MTIRTPVCLSFAERFGSVSRRRRRHHDVGGVSVEVLPSPVVDGGCSWVGVSGGHLNLSERNARVEGSHDGRRTQHVRVDQSELCSLAYRPNPAVGGAPVEALTVVAQEDGTVSPFPDRKVDGASGAGHQGYEGRFVALTDDPQQPVSSFESHVFDVGLTSLADPQTVQPKEHGQGGVGMIEPLCCEEKPAQLSSVQSALFRWVHGRSANVLGRV